MAGLIPSITIATHFYPASDNRTSDIPLVLLHGWASDSSCWQAILPKLNEQRDIIAVDLPNFGGSDHLDSDALDVWLQVLLPHLPARAIYIGWSLGGMLAAALAGQYRDRVEALVTIGSNAKFVRGDGWRSAMAEKIERGFYQSFVDSPEKTLKTFSALEAQGELDERAALKRLRAQKKNTATVNDGWRVALQLLANIDNRQVLPDLAQPVLHILGRNDALVNSTCAKALQELNAAHSVEVLDVCGHAPHITQPHNVLPLLLNFLSRL